MEFLKNNWTRISKILFYIIGTVFFTLALINVDEVYATLTKFLPLLPASNATLAPLAPVLATATLKAPFAIIALYATGIVFFIGMIAYEICKMFDVSFAKFILLTVGIINLALVCIFLFGVITPTAPEGISNTVWSSIVEKQSGIQAIFNNAAVEVAPKIAMAIFFAFMPLVEGIKKTFFCKDVA